MPSLSPILRARHAGDNTQFPSDVEASSCSSCSSPSPDDLGYSSSPSILRASHLRRGNADCTTKDSYASVECEVEQWARLHPEHFTLLDPPSVHAVEVGESGPHEYMIGYPSPTDEVCCEKGIYFTFVMDSATDFSSIATTSRPSSSGCVDRESSGSFGQEGYERNADRPTTLQELRKGRSSRPSISQRYSPLATTRRAKTSKILDWVADVENVRPKNQYGVQNGVMDKSRLPDTVELLYTVQPSSSGCSSPISSRSFCSSVRATEGPAFATSSPCPTEIILSSSPHSQVSGHGMDWDTVGDLFERPEANDYRHTAAYSPPFSSKSSSSEFLVTGPSPLAEDDTFVDATFDRVNDKLTNELALRLHRIGRRSNEMESIEVEEEVCYTQGGVMQTTTTIHQHLHTSPSHQSAQPPTYCNCADGSCATSLCDASGTGRWNSKRGRDVYQRSPHAIVPEDPVSPSSIDSFPMSTGGRPHNRPSFYGDNAQHSSGSHYSSYPPSAHGITPSSVTTSSDPHHHTSVSHSWDSCPIRPPMISPEVMSLAQPITIPLHQPQPVRPILTISISELASAEGYGGEHKLLQTPSKVRRGRLPKSERTSGVVQAPKWNGGVYSETYEFTPRR